MKRCPQCQRDYNDDSLSFCLDDGVELLFGPASTDEPETAIFPESEATTKPQTNSHNEKRIGISKPALLIGVVAAILLVGGFLAYRYWPTQKQISSVAVMPFVNQSGNADLEYLSDGLTESLISNLSQVPQLRVKARSSVFRYKGKDIDPASAGKELAVEAILNGRLIQQGNSVVLYAELVDAATEDILWTSEYSRPLTNLVQLQNELARDVAGKLQAKLSAGAQRFDRPQTNDEEAYRLYLMGRHHLNRLTDDGFRKGVEFFRQAIARDPNYALAYAGLANAYNRLGGFNADPPKESFPKGRDAALKSLELDNTLSEAHTQLATVKLFYDWDWPNAELEYKRAIELNPGDADAHYMYGLYLSLMRRPDEAIAEMRHAQELDPLSLEKQMGVGDVYFSDRRFEDAADQYRKALEMDPNSGIINWSLGRAYLELGKYDEAIELLRKSVALSGDSPDEPIDLARAFARSGNKQQAIRILSDLLQRSKSQYLSPTTIGYLYAALGDNDKAFEQFDRALAERDYMLVFMKTDPMFDPVKSDPRFASLAQRVGLP